jgi:N-acetylglucosamine kinase-like BadF-type ATPase
MKNYVVGVDGGNTKTDYFLFDLQGNLIEHFRDGSCSHESVGFEKAEEILTDRINQMLTKHGLSMDDVEAGAFGLAGIDNHEQHAKFVEIFTRMGLPRFECDNDSFLGIVAGTSKGYGICSINGTGTVSGGIDPHGNRLQVGGIGHLVGDDAGGSYIAGCGVRAVYDSFYRCGDETLMTKPVFELLGITEPKMMMLAIGENYRKCYGTEATRIVFKAANENDGPALEILDATGLQLAKTSAGCARNLSFGDEIEIVLAGSVWVKGESPALFNSYKKYMEGFLPGKSLKFNILQVPPATGAVLWAMSLCGVDCFGEIIRNKVIESVGRYFG